MTVADALPPYSGLEPGPDSPRLSDVGHSNTRQTFRRCGQSPTFGCTTKHVEWGNLVLKRRGDSRLLAQRFCPFGDISTIGYLSCSGVNVHGCFSPRKKQPKRIK